MKRQKAISARNNLNIVFIFCFVVGIALIVSISIKLFTLLMKSEFDGFHRFTVAVVSARSGAIVSFSPESDSITILSSKGSFKPDTPYELLIPIDARVGVENSQEICSYVTKETFLECMYQMLWDFRKVDTSLTIIDGIRLTLFARSVSGHNIVERTISSAIDQQVLDSILGSGFIDESISAEKNSIKVVNGTGITGLGNRVARLIANMGGNVVAVNTSDKPIAFSTILFAGQKTYTVKKLENILNTSALPMQKSDISDIVVTIGKNPLEEKIIR